MDVVGSWYMYVDTLQKGIDNASNTAHWVCGDDANAKKVTTEILKKFGWSVVLDAGGSNKGHYLEVIAALWIDRLFMTGNIHHTFGYIE